MPVSKELGFSYAPRPGAAGFGPRGIRNHCSTAAYPVRRPGQRLCGRRCGRLEQPGQPLAEPQHRPQPRFGLQDAVNSMMLLALAACEVQVAAPVHDDLTADDPMPVGEQFGQLPEPTVLDQPEERPPLALAEWPGAGIMVRAGVPAVEQEPPAAAGPVQVHGEDRPELVGGFEPEARLRTLW